METENFYNEEAARLEKLTAKHQQNEIWKFIKKVVNGRKKKTATPI